jgi:hypothetical protein
MFQTMKEIEEKYDGYWIFMTNCKKGDLQEIIGGVVIAYNKSKQPIINLWNREYDSETYYRYIGDIPDGMGVLL